MKRLMPFSLLLLAAPMAGAVQLTDLSPTLTRTQADETLTKDYAYRVLSDLSVRRIWNLDDNRKLSIDFDPKKDELISITVDYKKPVSAKEGTAAVRDIAHAEEGFKWNKLDTKQAAKYGVSNAKALKVGKAYVIMECNSAGKCVRVSVFSSVPKQNRRHLSDISTTALGATAMGHNPQADSGKMLLEDEAKRLQTPNKTDLAKETPESDTMEDDQKQVQETTPAPEPEETPTVTEPESTPTATEQPEKVVKKAKKSTKPKNKYYEIMGKIGMENVTPVQLVLGGVGLVLLFTIIGIIRRRSEQKLLAAKARAMAAEDPSDTLRSRAGVRRPKLRQ